MVCLYYKDLHAVYERSPNKQNYIMEGSFGLPVIALETMTLLSLPQLGKAYLTIPEPYSFAITTPSTSLFNKLPTPPW